MSAFRPLVFKFLTNNIGDEIQSLAAEKLAGVKCNKIWRDHSSLCLYQEPQRLIANGWLMQNRLLDYPRIFSFAFERKLGFRPFLSVMGKKIANVSGFEFPFSSMIKPLFISVHISVEARKALLQKKNIAYWRSWGPIGCRDLSTLQLFQSLGVESYFSGCLTMSLKPKEVAERENVYFVDAQELYDFYIQKKLSPKESTFAITHIINPFCSLESRFNTAQNLIGMYSRAKLVVTSRLHAALPALALGAPVLFVPQDLRDPRFTGLLDFVNTASLCDVMNQQLPISQIIADSHLRNGEKFRTLVLEQTRVLHHFLNS